MKFALFVLAFTAVEAITLSKKGGKGKKGGNPEGDMVQDIIDELDTDNSGDISLNELLTYAKTELDGACKEYDIPATTCDSYWEQGKEFLTEMFNQTDTDGSGAVDKSELEAALKGGK